MAAGASLTLHEAVYLGDLDLARRRLEAGDDPNTAEGCYQGPILMKAADDGNLALVDLLLDFGANIEAMDDLGRRPLLSAAGHGQTKVVRRLLDRGADLDVRDWGGHAALAEAARGGHGELARWLIDRGAKRGVVDALILDDLPVLADLLDEAIRLHTEEPAAEPNEADLAEDDPSAEWIRPSAVDQIYQWGGRLAMQAASRGNEAAVALLLDRGASPLIDRKTSSILVGIDDHSLLAEAARHGHSAVICLLIGRGADLHAVGEDGLTPLAWALREDQAAAAALLREAGATH